MTHIGSAYHDATLGKVVDGDGERVADVEGPVVEGADAAAKDGAGNDVDHEMTEEIEAVDRGLSGQLLEDLQYGQRC